MIGFDNSIAVVIGINEYTNVAVLQTAVPDAQRLSHTLKQEHGYETIELTKDVTKQRLLSLLEEELPKLVAEGDRILFYFAGHGIATESDDGLSGYLVPQDALQNDLSTLVPMKTVHDCLVSLPCRHALIILDCCFAGAFRSSTRTLSSLPEVIYSERYQLYIRDPAWQVIASASYDERAQDTFSGFEIGIRPESRNHSPFAMSLFDALAGEADLVPRAKAGKKAGDGLITATELYIYLRDQVQFGAGQRGHHQTPATWTLARHDRGEYVFLTPGASFDLPPAPPLTKESNPYRGLDPYYEEQSARFFGRDQFLQGLYRNVCDESLTVVVGPSSSGKTSVVNAGLLPLLRKDQQNNWAIASPILLQDAPINSLQKLQLPGEVGRQSLADSTLSLSSRVSAWRVNNADKKLVIVIDQVENLVTRCNDQNERTEFVRQLRDLLLEWPAQVRLILIAGSGFMPDISRLAPSLFSGAAISVEPMSQNELRKAIEGPANFREMHFEPYSMVEDLINAVLNTPGALPVLSQTLSGIYGMYWDRRLTADRALINDDYEALGNVKGVLVTHAEKVYRALPDDSTRETFRRAMLRLVSLDGNRLTGRRAPVAEFEYDQPEESTRVSTVIERLTENRLIVHDLGSNGARTIELAHDDLADGWRELRTWIDENAAIGGMSWRQHWVMTDDAARWHGECLSSGKGSPVANSLLGNRKDYLRQAKERLARFPFEYNAVESAFVKASLERQRILYRRTWTLAAVAVLFAAGLSIMFYVLSDLADKRISQQLSAQLTTEMQQRPVLAELLATEAYGISKTLDAKNSLLYTLQQRPALLAQHSLHIKSLRQKTVNAVAFAPDGRIVASVGADHTVVLFDAATGRVIRHILLSYDGSPEAITFSPDGKSAIAGGIGGWLASIDIESGIITSLGNVDISVIESLAFSSDGKWLAISGQEQHTVIREWGTDRSFAILPDTKSDRMPGLHALRSAFSPDSKLLGVGYSDGDVRIYSVGDWRQSQTLHNDTGDGVVFALAFTRDSLVAVAERDGKIRLWNAITGKPNDEQLINRSNEPALSLAFSGDGRLLACATEHGPIEIWKMSTRSRLTTLAYHSASSSSVAFDPTNRRLCSGGFDGQVAVWDVYGFQSMATPILDKEPSIGSARFGPDGQTLVAIDFSDLMVWRDLNNKSFTTGKDVGPSVYTTDEISFNALAFSRDGKIFASGGEEYLYVRNLSSDKVININVNKDADHGQVVAVWFEDNPNQVRVLRRGGYWQQWDLEDGKLLSEHKFTNHSNVIFAAFRSSDGAFAWQTDKDVRLATKPFDANSFNEEIIESTGESSAVIFSPNGRYLGWTRDDGTVCWTLIDAGARHINQKKIRDYPIQGLAFNNAGTMLAAGNSQGSLFFFDTETSQQIGPPLSTLVKHPSAVADRDYDITDVVRSLHFAPDDQHLVSYSDRAGPVIWEASPEAWVALVGKSVNRNLTSAEWQQFFGVDTPYRKTIADLPVGDDVTTAMLLAPGRVWFWLALISVAMWMALALLIIPWSPTRKLREHRVLLLIAVASILGVAIVLWNMPRITAASVVPFWGDRIIRLSIFVVVSVLCILAQKYLGLGVKRFSSAFV